MTEGLFSWLNDLFSWLFSLGMSGKLNWIEHYWPTFVLIIAIFVVLMDILIWLVRYKPYRIWKSLIYRFLRRDTAEKRQQSAFAAPPKQGARADERPQKVANKPAEQKQMANPLGKAVSSPVFGSPLPVFAPPPPRVPKEPASPPLEEPPTEAARVPVQEKPVGEKPVGEKPLGIEPKASSASDDDVPTIR